MAKTFEVKDVHTSNVWVSNKQHNATTFNNHEVVRLTAEMMYQAQRKHGVTDRTLSAKEYVAYLLNQDLGLNLVGSDMNAPLVIAQADKTDELGAYITSEFQGGKTEAEIIANLKAVGWTDQKLRPYFKSLKAKVPKVPQPPKP